VKKQKNYSDLCIETRLKLGGRMIEMTPRAYIRNKDDLSTYYTPGIAEPCRRINKNVEDAYKYTTKNNTVAVISDGTAVLGLGDIGPEAGLPVMEGKAILFKRFGGVDAVPIVIGTKDPDEIEKFVRWIAPTFGGINLEDISSPRCIGILKHLQDVGIPVFHDDQDGTAIVVAAAFKNALKVTGRKLKDLTVVINGAGAAGYAIAKRITSGKEAPKKLIICDSKGIVYDKPGIDEHKREILGMPGAIGFPGTLADAMKGADVFIGVSKAGLVSKDMVRSMNPDPILFPMANPIPEIMPDEAREAGCTLIGTGRSDFPNQINNVLAFPYIFRGALDARATQITSAMMNAAVDAIASCVAHPTREKIVPSSLSPEVGKRVSKAVADAWLKENRKNKKK